MFAHLPLHVHLILLTEKRGLLV